MQAAADDKQGFPILENRRAFSENQIKSLLGMSIEIAHLMSNVAPSKPIHKVSY